MWKLASVRSQYTRGQFDLYASIFRHSRFNRFQFRSTNRHTDKHIHIHEDCTCANAITLPSRENRNIQPRRSLSNWRRGNGWSLNVMLLFLSELRIYLLHSVYKSRLGKYLKLRVTSMRSWPLEFLISQGKRISRFIRYFWIFLEITFLGSYQ